MTILSFIFSECFLIKIFAPRICRDPPQKSRKGTFFFFQLYEFLGIKFLTFVVVENFNFLNKNLRLDL